MRPPKLQWTKLVRGNAIWTSSQSRPIGGVVYYWYANIIEEGGKTRLIVISQGFRFTSIYANRPSAEAAARRRFVKFWNSLEGEVE